MLPWKHEVGVPRRQERSVNREDQGLLTKWCTLNGSRQVMGTVTQFRVGCTDNTAILLGESQECSGIWMGN